LLGRIHGFFWGRDGRRVVIIWVRREMRGVMTIFKSLRKELSKEVISFVEGGGGIKVGWRTSEER